MRFRKGTFNLVLCGAGSETLSFPHHACTATHEFLPTDAWNSTMSPGWSLTRMETNSLN